MTVVILCGLQGSGKSSFCREFFWNTHVRLSLDVIGTRAKEQILVHACLAAMQPFVIDNTNTTAKQRQHYAALAHASGFSVDCYHLLTPLEECLRRNDARAGNDRIPEIGIRGAAAKFEPPNPSEGFDRLFHVRAMDGRFHVEQVGARL
jgi:predicted kinase